MLVLSRKESQRIRVGDSVVVTIVKIAGDKVRVGIEAPSEVLVLRDELQAHTVIESADTVSLEAISLETTSLETAPECVEPPLQKSA